MSIVEQINSGIKEAMRSRDSLRLGVLRMLKSKILAADARGNLSDEEVIKLFKSYFGNLKEAFDEAEKAGRKDVSEPLKLELAIVQEFLPKPPSLERTEEIVKEAISKSGAKLPKDLGFVMKEVMQIDRSVDGKLAKELAMKLLS